MLGYLSLEIICSEKQPFFESEPKWQLLFIYSQTLQITLSTPARF